MYRAVLMKSGLLQPALATALSNGITSLQDTLTNLERVRTTPLPFAYQAHLRMTLWYISSFLLHPIETHLLPQGSICSSCPYVSDSVPAKNSNADRSLSQFQIHSFFKVLVIPATAFTSFLLLGFLEIGQEIEDVSTS